MPAPTTSVEPSPPEQIGNTSFVHSLVGPGAFDSKFARRLGRLSETQFVALVACAVGALLYIPYLGAVGLWDPWETHYGEVGRMMIERNDYVYPWWESAWFFSKPPLTMWMDALGMQIVGTNRTSGALALYTEWGMRLPFAISSIASTALMTVALARTLNRRIAFSSMFVLYTMPLYFLLTRQAVTDTPFVACLVSAMACAIIARFDPLEKHRTGYWYAFWVFSGLGLLAKELPALGMPTVILFIYACFFLIPWRLDALSEHVNWLMNGDNFLSIFLSDIPRFRAKRTPPPTVWALLFEMRFFTGLTAAILIFGPWLLALSLFEGVDDESKTFFYRFFIHDNLNRLFAGVHTTTPGGTFTYFIEQGGYAIFPWVAALPGALMVAARIKLRSEDRADHIAFIAVSWVAFSFFLYASSATKFHHYVFPVLPGIAILIGIFIDRLWREGIAAHAVALVFGFIFFVLVGKDLINTPKDFTDLFVYNYDRPYPQELVDQALRVSDIIKPIKWFHMNVSDGPLFQGHVIALVLLLLGGYQLLEALTPSKDGKAGNAFGRFTVRVGIAFVLVGLAILIALKTPNVSSSIFVGIALVIGGIALMTSSKKFAEQEQTGVSTGGGIVVALGALLLIVGLNRTAINDPLRPMLVDPVNIKDGMKYLFTVGGLLAVLGAFWRARTMTFASFGGMALVFALWFNWSHWVDLSHHWTQRDQFWRYYAQRKPGEPIAAFLMNWRGETFYSKNTVKQLKENPRLNAYANQPGREWSLVEHYRFGILKSAVGPDKNVSMIDRDLNNKFVLTTIDGPESSQ